MTTTRRPTLAVFKFTSCDGCQLSLLDLEEELLTLATRVDIAYFREATDLARPGPYDLVIVEGSVSTAAQIEHLRTVRAQARRLVAIGACATAGGIQALRNFLPARDEDLIAREGRVDPAWAGRAYPHPEWLDSLARSSPLAAHVPVDYSLQGCPVDKHELLEVILAYVDERRPAIADESVCAACKRRGVSCVTVTSAIPCMGPVTHSGCGAICPAHDRGCYGCFGPKEHARADLLAAHWAAAGVDARTRRDLLRSFNGWATAFRSAS
ncbi:MAG: oxidoreductase [Pseudomonadales bacterium]|jgi:coenzyme F420-reducing hydrogenase gamma subunit|nr:oxidoreductase [Pseudomonadales bacterium]